MRYIQITPEQQAFMREGIAAGRFRSEIDAIRDALSLWEERERRRAEVLAAVDKAEASLAAGRGRLLTSRQDTRQLAEDAKCRGVARFNADNHTRR